MEASSMVVSLLRGSLHVGHFLAQMTAVFEAIADVQPRHFPFLAFLHGCGLDHGHHQYVDVVAREPCACG
jgi:hypothetical protein